MAFEPISRTLEGSFHLPQPADAAFPLFSPQGEEAWAPGWQPEFLHPSDGAWQSGLVFRTLRDGQEAIWFVGELDPQSRRVTYYRVDTGLAAITVRVACCNSESGTIVTVRYTFVGISEAGNEFVQARNQPEFDAWMAQWQEWIAALEAAPA